MGGIAVELVVELLVEDTIGNGEKVFVTTDLEFTESWCPLASDFPVRPFLPHTCTDAPHASGVHTLVPLFLTDSVCNAGVFLLVPVLCGGLEIAVVGAEMTNDGKACGVHLTPIS